MNSLKLLALGAFLVGSVAVYGNTGANPVDSSATTTEQQTTTTTTESGNQLMTDAQAKAECLKTNPSLKGAELDRCIKSKTKAE